MKIEELKKELELKQKKTARKYLLAIIVVGIIVGGLSGVTAYSFSAKQVSFTPSNKAWKVNNVNDAIESLQLSKTSTNYSTEEQVIGTWIDGKPLYQKTLLLNTLSFDSTTSLYRSNTDIGTNVDMIINYNTIVIEEKSLFRIGNRTTNIGGDHYLQILIDNYSSTTSPNCVRAITNLEVWKNRPTYVTIQYTKTADSATNS